LKLSLILHKATAIYEDINGTGKEAETQTIKTLQGAFLNNYSAKNNTILTHSYIAIFNLAT